jgi:GTPase SAR1 family protein
MAIVNKEKKEITSKILYFGADGGGKASNLCALLRQSSSAGKTEKFSIVPEASTLPFRFLPLSVGSINNYLLKIHLYSCAESIAAFPLLERMLLTGVDGFVFVVDSAKDRAEANVRAWRHMTALFARHRVSASALPQVLQFNKRDLKNASSHASLRKLLKSTGRGEIAASARQGLGTRETLQSIVGQVFGKLR